MKNPFKRGFIAASITFVLMMVWAAIAMFFNPDLPDSPVAFSIKRYWPVFLGLISLGTSFVILTIITTFSSLFGIVSRWKLSRGS